ncbi:Redoxin [Flagelloscypha sp. PMI_526]|nr:Redoxin [Flagelloscypha sp. PMI_526]
MATIKVGDTLPENTFLHVPWSEELENNLACGIAVKLNTNEWKGKKVVLVGIPGAFTPTCHAQHLPPYLQKYDEFKAKGIDVVAFVAANDPFVLSGWGRFEGVKDKILVLSDTDAAWSKKMGLALDIAPPSMQRTKRYVIVVDDLVIKVVEVESSKSLEDTGAEATLARL